MASWATPLVEGIASLALLAIAGCATGPAPSAPPDDAQLIRGSEIYGQCARCHGSSGEGGYGPRLAGTVEEKYPDMADQIEVIANGAPGMPPFSNRLSASDLDAVVRYTREVL